MSVKKLMVDKLMNRLGWTLEDDLPEIGPKAIWVYPTHTSEIDALIAPIAGLFVGATPAWSFLSSYWYDKRLLKPIFEKMNFIRIDKYTKGEGVKTLNSVVDQLANKSEYHLSICPEGTTEYIDHWKPGFYYLAKKLKCPIYVIRQDYKRKIIGYSNPMFVWEMTKKELMDSIREYVDPEWALHPGKVGEINFKKKQK